MKINTGLLDRVKVDEHADMRETIALGIERGWIVPPLDPETALPENKKTPSTKNGKRRLK